MDSILTSLISYGPVGLAIALLVLVVGYLFRDNQGLHAKHLELLEKSILAQGKVDEAVRELHDTVVQLIAVTQGCKK